MWGWVIILGALLGAQASYGATPTWCQRLWRAYQGKPSFAVVPDDPVGAYTRAHETSVAKAYASNYTQPPPADPQARVQLLARLGLLTGALPDGAAAPRVVKSTESEKHHGGGGTYHRAQDQFGDLHGSGPDTAGTFPELSRYFNLPSTHPAMAPYARFLREADRGFPRDRLQPGDYRLLEPLPQSDPLRSYLGVNLVRVWTGDGDKHLPPYQIEAPAGGVYPPNANYFRRGDGTYYIYDLPWAATMPGPHIRKDSSLSVMQQGMTNIVEALATEKDPAKRRELIRFYVESVMVFPEVGKERVQRFLANWKEAQRQYAQALATYQGDRESLLYRLVAGRPGRTPPEPPYSPVGLTGSLGPYFGAPDLFLQLHRTLGHDRTQPDLYNALKEANDRWWDQYPEFARTLTDAPDPLQRSLNRVLIELNRGP